MINRGGENTVPTHKEKRGKQMLKEMFEQFVSSGAVCISYESGRYLYTNKSNSMSVSANVSFPYEPRIFEELVHRDIVDIKVITIR